jgi:hypothetical protein
MKETEEPLVEEVELPDSWWHKVYAGVVLATVLVIFALWAFSQYYK